MSQDLRLSAQDQDFAMRIFDTAAVSNESFDKFAEQFYQAFAGDPQMIEMMMDILVRIAMADGVLSDKNLIDVYLNPLYEHEGQSPA